MDPSEQELTPPLEADLRLSLLRFLATESAPHYVDEVLLPSFHSEVTTREEAKKLLACPIHCLRVMLGNYAFARRGRGRRRLSECATRALHLTLSEQDAFTWLEQPNAELLWRNFCATLEDSGGKPNCDLDLGVIAGFGELAQEAYREAGLSVAALISEQLSETHRIEPIFMRIVDVRGCGPKIVSHLLRDFVYVLGCEEAVANRDLHFCQPIDRSVRALAPFLIEDDNATDFADWILAGKLGKAARRATVSGIGLNFGIAWLTHVSKRFREPDARFETEINWLLRRLATNPERCANHQA